MKQRSVHRGGGFFSGLTVVRLGLLGGLAGLAGAAAVVTGAATPAPSGTSDDAGVSPVTRALQSAVLGYEIVELDLPMTAAEPFETTVTLGGTDHVIAMHPVSKRAPGFRVMVPDEFGALEPTDAPAPRTMRGVVRGHPDSVVVGSVHEGRMTAIVRLAPEGQTWSIQSLAEFGAKDAPAGAHVIYAADQVLPVDGACGTIDPEPEAPDALEPEPGERPQAPASIGPAGLASLAGLGGGSAASGGNLETTDIAIDADFEYFTLNGSSVANTVADIENVINAVDVIYQRDVEICWNITLIIVRDSEPDPYSSSNYNTLLSQFRTHWNSQQSGNRTDHMHLFTGRDLNGGVIGVANCIGCICSLSQSYALSQARFSGIFPLRVGLVSHEIGHVYGAFHCQGGSCNGCSDCRIMCACINACCFDVFKFGQQSINSIRNHRNSRTCLVDGCGDPCPEDLDGSGFVDFPDILLILGVWGPCGGCPEDLDQSGAVDFGDILLVLSKWGPCP